MSKKAANKKIVTGLPKIDEEMAKELPIGELFLIIGSTGKSNIHNRMLVKEDSILGEKLFTKHENLGDGDTVFPVTYYSNGFILVDYPELFCRQIKDKK